MVDARPTAATWEDLDRELGAWRAAGQVATMWWRDDDAVSATPALGRLLDLAEGTPLALATIPGEADHTLAECVARSPAVSVAQHGWRHVNHAAANEKRAELGAHRPVERIVDELAAGWQRLRDLFGARAMPVLVPPWNRIADLVLPHLGAVGFAALSAYGPRLAARGTTGLFQINAHADLIDWRGSCGFVGSETALGRIVAHLTARRVGSADRAEPTGILTHHLRHDRAVEDFLREFLARTRQRSEVRWVAIAEAIVT
jgi:hypothetical protein